MAVIVIFIVIFLFIPLAKQDETQFSLSAVLNTIKKLIGFYKEEYQNINIDSLYGLRVLEGHTAAIIKKYEAGELRHLSKHTVQDLQDIRNQASAICEQALRYVRKDDQKYFDQLKYVVSGPWDIFEGKRRKVDLRQEWSPEQYRKAKENVHLDETKSDRCMSELIGSHRPGGVPCDISSQCVFLMTSPGLVGYGITHQLLWTMLAEKADCRGRLEEKLSENKKEGLSSLRLEMCSNNYIQMINTLKKFHDMVILPAFQDLYLEQLFICPSLGFYEFLDIKLLPQILSWQHKRGCYGSMRRPSPAFSDGVDLSPVTGQSDYDYDDNGQELEMRNGLNLSAVIGNLKIDHQIGHNLAGRNLLGYADISFIKGRQLLVEKEMRDGCLAHKTGVAAGALVLFLRFLCEPDAPTIFNNTFQAIPAVEKVLNRNQAQSNLTSLNIGHLKGLSKSNQASSANHDLAGNAFQRGEVDPDEIKLGGQVNTVNINSKRNLLNSSEISSKRPLKPQPMLSQPKNDLHNLVLRQNEPVQPRERRADDADKKLVKNGVNERLVPVKEIKASIGIVPGQIAKPDQKFEEDQKVEKDQNIQKDKVVGNPDNVQKPVELEMPADDDDDDNGNYDGNDDDYDDDDDNDGYDDDGDYDDYNKNDVPLQKDPDYVANQDEKDDKYNGDYDDGNDDYVQEPKSLKENKPQKLPDEAANKELLKGHINSRNIVNRNDFQADHEYSDNKRYDDKIRHGKNLHDRYAYDDYGNNANDDDDDDDDDGDDYDYDDKNEHQEVKDTNADIKLESVINSKDTASGALRNDINISKGHTVSSSSALFVFAFCFVSVVLLAYRFIKKRRIHFRFNPRISHRV